MGKLQVVALKIITIIYSKLRFFFYISTICKAKGNCDYPPAFSHKLVFPLEHNGRLHL